VVITPIYLYRLIHNKRKWIWFFYLLIIGYSILITEARISLVAYFVILILGFWKLIKVNTIKIFAFVYISAICLLGGFLLQDIIRTDNVSYLERFQTLDFEAMYQETLYAYNMRDYKTFLVKGPQLYYAGTDLSYSMRMSKWFNYLDGLFHNPVFGLGLSTTGEAVDGNYIRYLAESGLLGFTLWSILILTILKSSKHLAKRNLLEGYLVYLATIGLLIMALFIDVFEASKVAMFFWFIIGWVMTNFDKSKNHLTFHYKNAKQKV